MRQAIDEIGVPFVDASADNPVPFSPEWVAQQWRRALCRYCRDRSEQFLRVENRNGRIREVDTIPGDDCRDPGVSRRFMQHRILEVREVEVERPVDHVPVQQQQRRLDS